MTDREVQPKPPGHPDLHTYAWTKSELEVITKYGEECFEAGKSALPLTAPATDDEIDAAFDALDLLRESTTVKEMRRALEGFAAGRAAGVEPALVEPTNDELEALWETTHCGHPADFAADVLERWGGWPPGVLGHGGSFPANQPAVVEPTAKDLHAEIMNLPCNPGQLSTQMVSAYRMGHRDARHAAAELAATI